MNAFEELNDACRKLEVHRKFNKLHYYRPWAYQVKFHTAEGHDTPGKLGKQRALIAANKIGKTYCAAMEVAMHATGRYPENWKGLRFKRAPKIIVGCKSNELTRDVCQAILFGDPQVHENRGSGAIPRDAINGEPIRKPGVPNAFDCALVKHKNGGISKVFFRAYEQGAEKHMGFHMDFGWMDEEPPQDILSQYLRAFLVTRGYLILTLTPESGVTQVVNDFLYAPRTGMVAINATWDDCPLFADPEYRKQAEAQFPEHEREMRSKGIPLFGTGLVWTTPDDSVAVEPFEIPAHWPRIKAVDFGVDHPFAAVAIALDRDTDTAYLYWCYRESRALIAKQASVLNNFDPWIPVMWPHDGLIQDKQSGKPLADMFREAPNSVNMWPECFSNPPAPDQKEGHGGQGVEVGLIAIDEAMQKGKFKVFKTCQEWFEEKRIYHRKNGKVVKEREDLMSATRYAYQSRRFASTPPVVLARRSIGRGARNW